MNSKSVLILLKVILGESILDLNQCDIETVRGAIAHAISTIEFSVSLHPELDRAEQLLIQDEQMIYAVKVLRDRTMCSLRGSMDACREYRAKYYNDCLQQEGKLAFQKRLTALRKSKLDDTRNHIRDVLIYLKK